MSHECSTFYNRLSNLFSEKRAYHLVTINWLQTKILLAQLKCCFIIFMWDTKPQSKHRYCRRWHSIFLRNFKNTLNRTMFLCIFKLVSTLKFELTLFVAIFNDKLYVLNLWIWQQVKSTSTSVYKRTYTAKYLYNLSKSI